MAPRDFQNRLTRRAARVGLFLSADVVASLTAYYELLSRWNKKINLTALADPDEAIDRLLLEPLLAARQVPPGASKLMDIGSGGGSPAIPLKICLPLLDVTMVEVKARKSAFLREAIRQLSLDRTSVETARYEELLTRPELHEAHDAISIRAVRVESRSLATLQAFLKPGGIVMLFRGGATDDEELTAQPLFEHVQTIPLIEAAQSRLTILSKRQVGRAG